MIVKVLDLLDNSTMLHISVQTSRFFFLLARCCCFVAIFGCSQNAISQGSGAKTAPSAGGVSLVAINSLAIAPIQISSAAVARDLGNYDLSGIEAELQSAFKGATNSDVVILTSVKGATKESLKLSSENQRAFAKKSDLDGLLSAEISSFSTRTGSAIGSNEGAEFGVTLQLLEVDSGRVLWAGSYHEHDVAAPLISVSGGELKSPHFRSVESLIKEGFAKLAAGYAEARLKTYLAK